MYHELRFALLYISIHTDTQEEGIQSRQAYLMSYLTGQVLQSHFGNKGDGPQAVPLRTLPLIDRLSVDRVS